jgi:hypothetical protein
MAEWMTMHFGLLLEETQDADRQLPGRSFWRFGRIDAPMVAAVNARLREVGGERR